MGSIDDVKARIDIVDLIGQRVPLKRSGKSFRGPCPFHGDRTPSFFVYPEDWHYHCFGCQAHGNGFDFVMATENLEFRDALKLLAARADVELEPPARAAADNTVHNRLRAINEAAALFFHHLLLNAVEGAPAREYLAGRGTQPAAVEQFQLGYAPDSWDRLLRYLEERGYSEREAVEAGLSIERDSGGAYDRFRHRLMFPILDGEGRVIGFGGRVLRAGDQPKYLNTPQTPLFDKSATLYGLSRAKQAIRRQAEVVIVEGYMDVVGVHQAGYQNVVATMGTALSQRHLQQLHKLAKRIVLALDPDAAGDDATLRNVELASEVLERREVPVPTAAGRIRFERSIDADLRVARLPDGVDPDELVQQQPAEWQRLIENARPVVDFIFDAVLAKLDTTTPEDRDTARQRLLPVVREVSDRLQQAYYLQRLARTVQVDERVLRLELARQRRVTKPGPAEHGAETAAARPPINQVDAYALWLLFNHVQLWSRSDELEASWLHDPDSRRMFIEFRAAGSPQMLRERLVAVDLAETLDRVLTIVRPPMTAEEIDEVWEDTLSQLRRRYLRERVDALGLFCQEAFRDGDAERVTSLGEEIRQLTNELLDLDRSARPSHRAAVNR